MRAVTDEIEREHATLGHADRPVGRRVLAAAPPPFDDRGGVELLEPEQREQAGHVGQAGPGDLQFRVLEAGERAGDEAGRRVADAGGQKAVDLGADGWFEHHGHAVGALEHDDRGAQRRKAVLRRRDHDAGHRPGLAPQQRTHRRLAAARQLLVVDHDDEGRPWRVTRCTPAARGRPRASASGAAAAERQIDATTARRAVGRGPIHQ